MEEKTKKEKDASKLIDYIDGENSQNDNKSMSAINESDFYTPEVCSVVIKQENSNWLKNKDCFLGVQMLSKSKVVCSAQSVYFTPTDNSSDHMLKCNADSSLPSESSVVNSQENNSTIHERHGSELYSIVSDSEQESVNFQKAVLIGVPGSQNKSVISSEVSKPRNDVDSPVIELIERKNGAPVLCLNAIEPNIDYDENTMNSLIYNRFQMNNSELTLKSNTLINNAKDDFISKELKKDQTISIDSAKVIKDLPENVSLDCNANELCEFDSLLRETTIDSSDMIRTDINAIINALSSPPNADKEKLGMPMCTSSPFDVQRKDASKFKPPLIANQENENANDRNSNVQSAVINDIGDDYAMSDVVEQSCDREIGSVDLKQSVNLNSQSNYIEFIEKELQHDKVNECNNSSRVDLNDSIDVDKNAGKLKDVGGIKSIHQEVPKSNPLEGTIDYVNNSEVKLNEEFHVSKVVTIDLETVDDATEMNETSKDTEAMNSSDEKSMDDLSDSKLINNSKEKIADVLMDSEVVNDDKIDETLSDSEEQLSASGNVTHSIDNVSESIVNSSNEISNGRSDIERSVDEISESIVNSSNEISTGRSNIERSVDEISESIVNSSNKISTGRSNIERSADDISESILNISNDIISHESTGSVDDIEGKGHEMENEKYIAKTDEVYDRIDDEVRDARQSDNNCSDENIVNESIERLKDFDEICASVDEIFIKGVDESTKEESYKGSDIDGEDDFSDIESMDNDDVVNDDIDTINVETMETDDSEKVGCDDENDCESNNVDVRIEENCCLKDHGNEGLVLTIEIKQSDKEIKELEDIETSDLKQNEAVSDSENSNGNQESVGSNDNINGSTCEVVIKEEVEYEIQNVIDEDFTMKIDNIKKEQSSSSDNIVSENNVANVEIKRDIVLETDDQMNDYEVDGNSANIKRPYEVNDDMDINYAGNNDIENGYSLRKEMPMHDIEKEKSVPSKSLGDPSNNCTIAIKFKEESDTYCGDNDDVRSINDIDNPVSILKHTQKEECFMNKESEITDMDDDDYCSDEEFTLYNNSECFDDPEISFGPSYRRSLLLDAVPVDFWEKGRCGRASQLINYTLNEVTEKYPRLKSLCESNVQIQETGDNVARCDNQMDVNESLGDDSQIPNNRQNTNTRDHQNMEDSKLIEENESISLIKNYDNTVSEIPLTNTGTDLNEDNVEQVKRTKKKGRRKNKMKENLTSSKKTKKPTKRVHFSILSDLKKTRKCKVTFDEVDLC